MEVILLDQTTHLVEANDLALLTQHINIDMPIIRSEDIFQRFRRFVNRHQLEENPELTKVWANIFAEGIMDTDTLHDVIMLASHTGQEELMTICCKRAADMLKNRQTEEVAALLTPQDPPGDGGNEDDIGIGENENER